MEIISPGYARVSEILSQWDKFSGIDKDVLEAKKILGTNVHSCIDMYNASLPYIATEKEEPYVQSYIRWKNREKFLVVESEKRYYDERLMITGKLDALVHFKDEINDGGQVTLCDWKCSYSEDPINWPLQASFYRYLLLVNGVTCIAPVVRFVKLDKNGDMPKIFEYKCSEQLALTCEAAVVTYRHQKPWLDKRKEMGDRE